MYENTLLSKLTKHAYLLICGLLSIGFFLCTKTALMDDAFIFYTYAKNLISGNGYVFNTGEYVNGTTSSLYTLVVAILGFLFKGVVKLPEIGRAVSAIGLFAICFYVGLMKMGADKKSTAFATLFALALFGNRMLLGAVGMETFLTLSLQMAALYYFLEKRYSLFSVLSSLAVLSRPDAILFVAVICIYYIFKERCLPPWQNFLFFCLPLALWYGFSFIYFGELLPNTFGAKLAQTSSGNWGRGFVFLIGLQKSILRSYGTCSWAILGIAGVVNLIFLRRLCRNSFYLLMLAWTALYLIAYGLILNPPSYPWYNTPIALFMALILSAPILLIGHNVIRACYLVLATVLLLFADLRVMKMQYYRKVPGKYDIYRRTALWINQAHPQPSTVAITEIGVVGYYLKNAHVIDALGLITKGGNQDIKNGNYAWYLEEYKPALVILNHPPRKRLENYAYSEKFKQQYELINIIRAPTHSVAVEVFKRREAN